MKRGYTIPNVILASILIRCDGSSSEHWSRTSESRFDPPVPQQPEAPEHENLYTNNGNWERRPNDVGGKDYVNSQSRPRHPPPPPPLPGAAYNPIHYSFQSRPTQSDRVEAADSFLENDELPLTIRPDQEDMRRLRSNDEPSSPTFASPRRDAFTKQLATRRGRFLLRISCLAVGTGVGHFIGQSLLQKPYPPLVVLAALLFLAVSFIRNAYGELVRALGLALIWTVQRSRRVRAEYPTWPHIKASCRIQSRVGFPVKLDKNGEEVLDDNDAVEFNQLYSLVAMSLVGAACGGSLPFIPTWMGALAGAGTLGMATSLPTARGDLARVMGARVVALLQEMLDINAELQVLSKLGVVSSKVLDKILILDRKHGLRDRIVGGFNFVYTQVTNAMNNQGSPADTERPRESARQRAEARGNEDDDTRYQMGTDAFSTRRR